MNDHANLMVDPKPLTGVKILDLSQGIAGPYAATILGLQGAEIIKVEPPEGDWSRLMGGGKSGLTALSIACNLGKRSICVDARKPAGQALLRELAADVDVLIESFRPGVMSRLGLDYPSLAEHCAKLLYTSVTGFGDDGPYRDLPGADSVIQALSGMMTMNRDAAGQPRRVGMLVVDAATGIYTAQAIAAALVGQTRTGKGGLLPITLMQAAAALQSIPLLDWAMHGSQENKPPVTVPSGTFRTREGLINLTALRDRMFHGLARALGQAQWIDDPRYATNGARLKNAADINAQIQALLLEDTAQNWVTRFRQHEVLCAPVLDYAGFMDDPQVRSQGIFTQIDQVLFGALPFAQLPGQRCDAYPAAPLAGDSTQDILVQAGLSAQRIDALRGEHVVFTRADLDARAAQQHHQQELP